MTGPASIIAAAALCFAAHSPAPPAGEVVAHWIFSSEHYRDGAFQPVEGGWPLVHAEPEFLGEGVTQSLLLPLQARLMTAGEKVEAQKLPAKKLSIEAWIALDVNKDWGGIFSAFEDNGGAETGILLGSRGQNFSFALASRGTGDSDGALTYLSARGSIKRGRWHHVVGTYDGKSQKIYVDGQLAGESAAQSGSVFYSPAHTIALAAYKDSNDDYRLSGAIHEVALHDTALNASDVRRRYKKLAGKLPAATGATFNNLPIETGPPLHKLQPAINQAISEGVEQLLREQHRDGSWSSYIAAFPSGATGLAVYTLQKCGLPVSHPAVVRGLHFMRAHPPTKTYEAACQLLALGATEDPAHKEWAEDIVDLLLSWESSTEPGGWAYPAGRVDLSNMQFVALGFWGANQLGVEVPVKVWQRMVKKTTQEHQNLIEEVDWPTSEEERSGKRKIAGFTYYIERGPWHESGCMTTAGLCTIGIPAMLLGSKLGATYRRMVAEGQLLGMGWLEHYYTDMWNETGYGRQGELNGILGDNFYYYLYGVERVGAFFNTDSIGAHPWYRDGAERLLKKRKADGSWGVEKQTCFALLFLRRASAPRPSGKAANREAQAFSDASGDVHIYATGRTKITCWVNAFDEKLLAEFGGEDRSWRGLRVVEVEYLANGEAFRAVPGEPTRAWGSESRFAVQHDFELPGEQTLQVIVKIVSPDGDPEFPSRTETIESAVLRITTEDSPEDWMAHNQEVFGEDLLGPSRPVASASSSRAGDGPASACDALHSTRWVSGDGDAKPWIRFLPKQRVRANTLTLSQANSKLSMRGVCGAIQKIQVIVNGGKPLEVELETDDLKPTQVDLGKNLRIRELEIRLLEFTLGKEGRGVGFSGVELSSR
jgi:hypothetical protein